MKQAYLDYYTPLVQQFCKDVAVGPQEGLDHLPQPFLPLFGKGYARSSFKFLVIGQDTKGWGKASHFVDQELAEPGSELSSIFSEIEDQNFTQWGKSTNSFWGFVMALLGSVHGMPNWNALKWGDGADILSSFAWANANAVELWPSLRKHTHGVPKPTWEAARAAGAHLNRFSHMLTTLTPRVVLITYSGLNRDEFFKGLDWYQVPHTEEGIRHYRINGHEVDIFHTYHPGYMRNLGGPWSFLNKLRTTLINTGLAPDFPEFIEQGEDGDATIQHLLASAPRPEGNNDRKYELVEWLATELTKHKAFISVPALARILNELGYTTNYGTEYVGTRGSYRVVRGAYHRSANLDDQEAATRIALTFRKPDFTYAYQT